MNILLYFMRSGSDVYTLVISVVTMYIAVELVVLRVFILFSLNKYYCVGKKREKRVNEGGGKGCF